MDEALLHGGMIVFIGSILFGMRNIFDDLLSREHYPRPGREKILWVQVGMMIFFSGIILKASEFYLGDWL